MYWETTILFVHVVPPAVWVSVRCALNSVVTVTSRMVALLFGDIDTVTQIRAHTSALPCVTSVPTHTQ